MISSKNVNLQIKKLRENLPLILAIPTVLGGLWQTFQLVRISPAFLKFFSSSQLISDGLFVGMMLFLIAIFPFNLAYKTVNYLTKHLSHFWLYILLIIVSLIQFTVFFFDLHLEKTYFILGFVMQSYTLMLFLVIAFNEKLKNETPIKFDNFFRSSFLFLSILSTILNTSILINKFSYSANKKIENFRIFQVSMRQIYPNAKLEYFNDKYIFFITDSTLFEKKYIIKDLNEIVQTEINSKNK